MMSLSVLILIKIIHAGLTLPHYSTFYFVVTKVYSGTHRLFSGLVLLLLFVLLFMSNLTCF